MRFMGYRRSDGRAGIRNHVLVMPGVLCAEVAARKIVEQNPDAMFMFNSTGCGLNQSDLEMTLDILSGMIANGNVYGVLIVGLGCEFIDEETYMKAIRTKTDKPVHYIGIQETGGIARTVEAGGKIVRDMLYDAAKCERVEMPLSELSLGLECGGSDPTSGFSSNLVLGKVSDAIIEAGGTVLMSETAEAIGAEHIMRDRCVNPDVGEKMYRAIVDWEQARYDESGENIRDSNPSPGNKAGGLTTLAEKSLGCITKSGSHPFDDVYEYGEMIDRKGLFFINASAYDVVNTVALVAAGAQIVAFTTGRGNPIGNPVAPVIKITGNSDTAEWLSDFIDFDTSDTLTAKRTIEEVGDELLEYTVRVADGEKTMAEVNGAIEMGLNQMHSYT